MKLRMAKKEDCEAILSIYKPYVLHSSTTFEYDVPSNEDFTKRMEKTLSFFPYLVIEEEKEIVGYAYASFFRERIAYQYSCELSIYIKEGKQGKGYGTRLYEALEILLKRQGFMNLNACITYPNEGSIQFHVQRGFVKNAHFHKCGYKFDTWYDMIWMEKSIGTHPIPAKPLKSIHEIKKEDILQ